MKTKTKALGLALVVVLAMGALSASAAQAENITAGAYPATLTMLDLNTEHGKLTRFTVGNGSATSNARPRISVPRSPDRPQR